MNVLKSIFRRLFRLFYRLHSNCVIAYSFIIANFLYTVYFCSALPFSFAQLDDYLSLYELLFLLLNLIF